MASEALRPSAVSAPGKVLLAGGYLVLDRLYTGLVFGLDARIHVHVQPIATSSGVTLSEIIVRSPQFQEATWEYGYRLNPDDGGIIAHQLRAYVFFQPILYYPFFLPFLKLSFVMHCVSTRQIPGSLCAWIPCPLSPW